MQHKNQEVIQALLFFMLHYLFWGIDELKTNLRRLHCDVVIHIQRVEERVKLPPKVRLEAVKLPG